MAGDCRGLVMDKGYMRNLIVILSVLCYYLNSRWKYDEGIAGEITVGKHMDRMEIKKGKCPSDVRRGG